MVNEPYAYAPEAKAACLSGGDRPSLRALGAVPSADGRTSLVAEYSLPADLPASLEVFDAGGLRVGVVAQGRLPRGVHAGAWKPGRLTPGDYWFRLRVGGADLLRKVALPA
jgi:hypothetical protein